MMSSSLLGMDSTRYLSDFSEQFSNLMGSLKMPVRKKFLNSEHEDWSELFRVARGGIFLRSSLLGAGQVGFWEFGRGGSIG